MIAALRAWLTAPAPMACTSARRCSRTTPAMAPATAEVREPGETLITYGCAFTSLRTPAYVV